MTINLQDILPLRMVTGAIVVGTVVIICYNWGLFQAGRNATGRNPIMKFTLEINLDGEAFDFFEDNETPIKDSRDAMEVRMVLLELADQLRDRRILHAGDNGILHNSDGNLVGSWRCRI